MNNLILIMNKNISLTFFVLGKLGTSYIIRFNDQEFQLLQTSYEAPCNSVDIFGQAWFVALYRLKALYVEAHCMSGVVMAIPGKAHHHAIILVHIDIIMNQYDVIMIQYDTSMISL